MHRYRLGSDQRMVRELTPVDQVPAQRLADHRGQHIVDRHAQGLLDRLDLTERHVNERRRPPPGHCAVERGAGRGERNRHPGAATGGESELPDRGTDVPNGRRYQSDDVDWLGQPIEEGAPEQLDRVRCPSNHRIAAGGYRVPSRRQIEEIPYQVRS